jgi:ABC-type lipoprotein release transport system permease subunit
MYLQLGWRNIWRNPRRTAVILTAVIIGVWSMVFSSALVRGLADQMVRNGVATLTGHIQIHHRGYRNDPAIENSIDDPDALTSVLARCLPASARWTERIRVNAVASNARHSDGVTLTGIDPAGERGVSFLPESITEGSYLSPTDATGVVIGRALADRFETRLGNKLILMSQDMGKVIRSRAFRIVGIYRADNTATETSYVFVNLPEAQRLLRLNGGISEISIILPKPDEVDTVAAGLRATLSARELEVHTWRELLPLVTASVAMYHGIIWLWNLVAFVVMGFGIVNTILMAVLERTREFGLFQALGMRPREIVGEVLAESLILLLLGMAVGDTLGLLSVLVLSFKGLNLAVFAAGVETLGMPRIIFPVITLPDLLWANAIVLVLGLVVSGYPAVRASRITPVQAMAHT